jgi:hypothetical protein
MDTRYNFYSNSKYFTKTALIASIAGLVLSIFGYFLDSKHFFYSYLVAYVFWASIMLGALFFTMLNHISGATWNIVLRRILEHVMNTVPLMAILFLPVLLGLHDLYHWSHEEVVANDALLQKKTPYLNAPFFIIRALLYFSIWYVLSKTLFRTSIIQDEDFQPAQIKKMRKISAPGIVLFAITSTFAAFDWLMSLDPHWYSTIFGLYIFAGSFLSILAVLVIFGLALRNKKILHDVITVEHYHDLGKYLFGFTVFWGYMAFSQYFLIWYANIPEETIWYLHRWEGTWKYITMLLVFGHFLLPFITLMPRAAKRNLKFMKLIGVWILVMHYFDIYWIVMPTIYEHGFHFSWIDLTTFVGISGIFLYYFWSKYFSRALVPVNDPHLKDSIEFKV